MPFITATDDIGVEGLVLDGLDLAQGPNGLIQLDAFTPPISKKRPEWIEASDSDGAILARDPLVSNGQAVIKLAIVGGNRDGAQDLIGQIVDKLEEADRNPSGIPLVWTPSGSTPTLTFYVLTGEVTDFPVDWESGYMVYQPSITITLDCAPYGYGDPITITGAATAGPLVTLDLPDIPGDVPSGNPTRFIITESSSQSRRTVEWGAEYLHYNPASPWSLVLDSDSLVTTGFAGTQTTLAGAYDPGATGNSIIVSTVTTSLQAICGTGAQPHVGTFRAKARINTGSGGVDGMNIRLAWRVGDGAYTTNDPVTVTDPVQEYLEIDLGLVTIPATLLGTQAWDGRVEAWSTVVDTVYIDYLLLFPVEAGYGKATASYASQPGVMTGLDSFVSIVDEAALNGRTGEVGGAWVTSGTAPDFLGETTGGAHIDRTDGSVTTRHALLGSATPTDTEVGVTVNSHGGAASGLGALARWVNATNFLLARTAQGVAVPKIEIVKVIGGVETLLVTSYRGSGGPDRLVLVVFASGRVILRRYTAAGSLLDEVESTDSALAFGGTLASGKCGIYDKSGLISATHSFDDFYMATPATEPIVLYSGRELEIRSDDTIRESSAGGTWGQPASYRGSRFKVNPAGDQGRTTRVVAKASRNDLSSAEDANLTDQIALQAVITPRYSVVPRS